MVVCVNDRAATPYKKWVYAKPNAYVIYANDSYRMAQLHQHANIYTNVAP